MDNDRRRGFFFSDDELLDNDLTELEERQYIDPEQSPIEEMVLFTWVSYSRVERPKPSRRYYLNLGLILFLIALILFFANQFALLMVVLALTFLGYVLINTKPIKVRHTLTNFGIRTDDKYFSWIQRGNFFWFEESYGQEMVVIETKKFPFRITMLTGNQVNKIQIKKVLLEYMSNKKPEPTQADKIIRWCKDKFPLD
ncbi:MAG: hypothetical protein LBG64_03125 [Pseudomonadales bacterium]|jgi:hypothetical protein|nr:hypothetical protein [Pseudomonadales bacterium]